MAVSYRADGSAFCQGEADRSRTATIAAGAGRDAAIAAFLALEPAPVIDPDSLAGVAARVPMPATAAPPAVSDTGTKGNSPLTFAMGDHTHASKARKQIAVSTSATYAWTYPSAFGSGVTPIVNGIAQVTSGTTDLFNVQIMGVPTNTGCVFQISRVSAGLFGLITGALGINPTPATINLHMLALEP